MEVIYAGNYYWEEIDKKFVVKREFYIHQYRKMFMDPRECTCCWPDTVYFVSREKNIDLEKHSKDFVAIISRTMYSPDIRNAFKTRCRNLFSVTRKGEERIFNLIASLPSKHVELLRELTEEVIKMVPNDYII